MSKTKKLIIVALIILNIIFWGIFGYSKLSHSQYKPKTYKYQYIYVEPVHQTLNKETARQAIKDLYKTPHFYCEKDLQSSGRSVILFRKVEIDKDLPLNEYIIAYAHELTHIKYVTSNETWVSYKTFKTLYESGDAELRYHAMVYASEVLRGYYEGTDYDCGYYILKYLAQ